MTKKHVNKTIGYVIIGILLLYVLISGVVDLCNKKNCHTVEITYAMEILEVEHSISGIIPMGTDYYYIGFDQQDNAYIIHGPKKWVEKRFGDNQTVTVKALAKKILDYKIQDELYQRVGNVEGVSFPYGVERCMELSYFWNACMKIGSVLLLVILFILGVKIFQNKNGLKPIYARLYLLLLVIGLIVLVKTLI